jgi:hypothetical protein
MGEPILHGLLYSLSGPPISQHRTYASALSFNRNFARLPAALHPLRGKLPITAVRPAGSASLI